MERKKLSRIAKNEKIPTQKKTKLSKKPGGSNIGTYKNVPESEFAGPSGGAPQGTYPINTKKRARAALSYAHNAPNPSGIKKKVYKEYPSLNKKNQRKK